MSATRLSQSALRQFCYLRNEVIDRDDIFDVLFQLDEYDGDGKVFFKVKERVIVIKEK